MKFYHIRYLLILLAGVLLVTCKKDDDQPAGTVQLAEVRIGATTLSLTEPNEQVAIDSIIFLRFNNILDPESIAGNVLLKKNGATLVESVPGISSDQRTITLEALNPFEYKTTYQLVVTDALKGANGEQFPGIGITFTTVNGTLRVEAVTLNGTDFSLPYHPRDVNRKDLEIVIRFSHPIDTTDYSSKFLVSGNIPTSCSLSPDKKTVTASSLSEMAHYNKYFFIVSSLLKGENGYTFEGFTNFFYTELDTTPKFPLVSDDELLTLVQRQTFRYFYDLAHPSCGLARERSTSGDIVTIGGSGFGVMALIVGMERGFITRVEGLNRLEMILGFLETCDRYHGAWPHWLNGVTGKTYPFSDEDDGADLVETSFMIQGLLTMRQYLDPFSPAEKELRDRIDTLAYDVEYDWFTRGQNVLYWHWSPTSGWAMNMKIEGYNETLIVYVLAASSPSHSITPEVYHEGYARNGGIRNGASYYGYMLPLGPAYGGPLFFTHYSFLGLDPRNLQDEYAHYWTQNVNQTQINRAYCMDNPRNWIGYSAVSWGLTASDNPGGYSAHSPTNDLGVISPTAAVSALPYTPVESMAAIRHFYYHIGDRLWGPYGYYDAFDVTDGWWATSYLAIDQGPMVCMIENYRTGLLWDLFMTSPDVQQGLTKLGFTY